MPIYEYKCKKCDNHFELLCSMGGANDAACPTCGSSRVSRLLSMFSARSVVADGSSHSCGGGCAECSGGSCSNCSCH